MSNIVVKANAKINLSLNVLGMLENGYHKLDMVICPIDMADEIIITKKQKGISIDCDNSELANSDNIAYRAAQDILQYTGCDLGVDIYITKKIWTQAGLGGGSSNAAAVLYGINQIYDLGLSHMELVELGIAIGADVPLFLSDGLVRVGGIGEQLEYFEDMPSLPIVIVQDAGGLSTGDVFDMYDRNPCRKKADNIMLIKSLQDNDGIRIYENMHNCLQNTSIVLDSNVGKAIDMMITHGASKSMMTGSGSAVYGIFEDMETANKAYFDLMGEYTKCRLVTTQNRFLQAKNI